MAHFLIELKKKRVENKRPDHLVDVIGQAL